MPHAVKVHQCQHSPPPAAVTQLAPMTAESAEGSSSQSAGAASATVITGVSSGCVPSSPPLPVLFPDVLHLTTSPQGLQYSAALPDPPSYGSLSLDSSFVPWVPPTHLSRASSTSTAFGLRESDQKTCSRQRSDDPVGGRGPLPRRRHGSTSARSRAGRGGVSRSSSATPLRLSRPQKIVEVWNPK